MIPPINESRFLHAAETAHRGTIDGRADGATSAGDASGSTGGDSERRRTLRIAETFTSRQGEGKLTGTPSHFIRTSGCNLRCWFCDTPYASWQPEGPRRPLQEIVQECREAPVDHVVLTGGEPLLPSAVTDLCRQIRHSDMHLTIETAGTIDRQIECDLLSLSPKLRGSGPTAAQHPGWARRHEQHRLPVDTMRSLMRRADEVQVKFVIDAAHEFDEVQSIVRRLGVSATDVYIMPQAVTAEQLDAAAAWLRPWCGENRFRYCDRMQIRWYGNRRGT